MNYTVPDFEVERNINRCISCGACVRQCSYEVHYFDDDGKTVLADESKCVACHRCAAICPTNKEMLGGMGLNSIDSLRGNRLMLRGIGLTEKELEILGISHAGEYGGVTV